MALAGAADRVLIAFGYDRGAPAEPGVGALDEQALVAMGAAPGCVRGLVELACAAIGTDVTGIALPATAA